MMVQVVVVQSAVVTGDTMTMVEVGWFQSDDDNGWQRSRDDDVWSDGAVGWRPQRPSRRLRRESLCRSLWRRRLGLSLLRVNDLFLSTVSTLMAVKQSLMEERTYYS